MKDYSIQKGKTILIKTSKRITQISIENIVYIECDSYLLSYYLNEGNKAITSTDSLKKIEEKLLGYNFLRINRNQLINMRYFRSYEIKNKIITLLCGKTLNISRRRLNDLKKSI